MKIKTDIHAGYSTFEECQKDLNYWKTMAQAMDAYSKTGAWPSDLPYPTVPTTPTYPPLPTHLSHNRRRLCERRLLSRLQRLLQRYHPAATRPPPAAAT